MWKLQVLKLGVHTETVELRQPCFHHLDWSILRLHSQLFNGFLRLYGL